MAFRQEEKEVDLIDGFDLENDEEDEILEWEETNTEEEIQRLRTENESLKRSKAKLIEKKHKAIQRKTTVDEWEGQRFEAFYQKKKSIEMFEIENPGVDYDVANAIAKAKWVEIWEAIHYIKQWWNYRIWQDKIPDSKSKQSEFEELKTHIASNIGY